MRILAVLACALMVGGCASPAPGNVTDGTAGSNGTNGSMGSNGEQGPEGPAGPQGAPGAQGPAGPMGNTGAKGSDGAQGPAGPAGATGEQGPVGPAGPSGGVAGAVGPMGPPGPAGPAGPAGTGGAGITKASLYEALSEVAILPSQGIATIAYCRGMNDVPLSGGCSVTVAAGYLSESRSINSTPDTQFFGGWTCSANSMSNNTGMLTAHVICLTVP